MYQGRVFRKNADGEAVLIGVVDLKTKKFISIENEEALADLRQSILDKFESTANEMLRRDPDIPFVYKDEETDESA